MSESSASEETAKAANSRDHVMAACLAESLPQELIILIVSHIRSRKDLHSCSTVCRSWSFSVQSRLFSDIVIKRRTGEEESINVQRWMKRFQSSPHICRAVTQISFCVELDKSVRELLEELPNVKKVIAYYWRPERVRTLERVKNLERLSLYQVNQGDLAHVTLEIKKMGHLKSLDISVDRGVTWTPSLLSEKALEGPVKLRVLRVMERARWAWNINSTGPIFDWLCSPVFDHSEVQMLSWKYTIRDRGLAGIETERLRYLFNALSPQLEILVLTLPGDWNDSGKLKLDPLCNYLLISAEALSKFPNLKTLAIHPVSEYWDLGVSTGIKKALVILEALRKYPVHTIHLSLDLAAMSVDLSDHPGTVLAFNKVFEYSSSDKMSSFPNLKRFYFHLYTNDLKLVAAMKGIMSELEKRNVLHVETLERRIFLGWPEDDFEQWAE